MDSIYRYETYNNVFKGSPNTKHIMCTLQVLTKFKKKSAKRFHFLNNSYVPAFFIKICNISADFKVITRKNK